MERKRRDGLHCASSLTPLPPRNRSNKDELKALNDKAGIIELYNTDAGYVQFFFPRSKGHLFADIDELEGEK